MSTLLGFTNHGGGSSLRPDTDFAVSAKTAKQGFLGIFLKNYSGADPTSLFVRLTFAAISSEAALVGLAKVRAIKKTKPSKGAEGAEGEEPEQEDTLSLSTWAAERHAQHIGRFASVRKVLGADAHFEIKLPLHKKDAGLLAKTWRLFTRQTISVEMVREAGTRMGMVPAQAVLANAKLPENIRLPLMNSLVGVEFTGGMIYAVFKAAPSDVEYMTNTEFATIRPVDVHPLINAWADASYVKKGYGKSALSITRIAQGLPTPKADDIRVDEHNLCIDAHGSPLYLLPKTNNADKYETLLTTVGSNPDGSFSLASDGDPEEIKRKSQLPTNIPVLTDWANLKFAYTDYAGKIQVMPLEYVRKCTPAAALNIIKRNNGTFKGVVPLVSQLVNFASKLGVNTSLSAYYKKSDADAPEVAEVAEILDRASSKDVSAATLEAVSRLANNPKLQSLIPDYHDLTNDPNWPIWRYLHRFIRTVVPAMENNIERLNVEYAVTTVIESLGIAKLLATYGGDMPTTVAKAATQKQASIDQSIDPNWTPPDAPLITKNFETEGGFLPHQAKVRNLLKDSPDIAVIDVKAGGGKSLISITDILYEIKNNRSAPYLLMCPGHLVPNYVSEVVEFTDGMVNAIPVTSENIRSSGYERYEQILEAAPINTVLIVDYGALAYRAQSAVYGTASVVVYPVVEMIRKFKPGYAMMDESHLLKNDKSLTARAVKSLVSSIPKKRIATGTLSPDSPSDLPGQLALLDPTILGSREEFNERFADPKVAHKGNRVSQWRPNAGGMVMDIVKANAVWCTAKRREWAAALPPRSDRFIKVELTPRQRDCYDALFDEMVQSLKKKAETDAKTKKLLDKLTGKKASQEDEEDFGDLGEETPAGKTEDQEEMLDDDGDVGAALQPHIAALERFVSNPAGHPYAANGWVHTDVDGTVTRHPPLTGDDLRSPKAVELEYRLREWFNEGNQSKVIIFANQEPSVQALWDQMPDDLKASGILYTAGDKVNIIHKFKTDPKIKWLIGIRKSMEVGLNLQAGGYLIRVEGCWNPGEQEQGDSRIERPKFGPGGDQRPRLLFDTIVADRTIDITKAARLRAKILAVAKFENPTDQSYQDIPDIPVFTMTLDNIQFMNDFDSNIKQYQDSMGMLAEVIKQDYAEYREKIKSEGGFKITNVKRSKTPAECGILSRVPYAMGTELYAAHELGLVRLDVFLGKEGTIEEDDEGEDEGEEGAPEAEDPLVVHQRGIIVGMRCHTELGEGVISHAGGRRGYQGVAKVRINLDDGSVMSGIKITKVFVVTRKETNSVDMRMKIAKAAGLPIVGEITVPAPIVKMKPLSKAEMKRREREEAERNRKAREKKRANLSLSIHLSVINGYMRLSYMDGDKKTIAALQSVGFKYDQPYVETRIRDHKHLIKQARAWADAGFNTTKEVDNDSLALLAEELATNGMRTHRHYVRTAGSFSNYMRKMWKPNPDKKSLNLFGLVTDGGTSDPLSVKRAAKLGVDPSFGIAYLCMPYGAAFPATRLAMNSKFKVPGTTWWIVEGNVSVFVNGVAAVNKVLEDLELLGVTVNNLDELNATVKSVRKIVPKDDNTLDVSL